MVPEITRKIFELTRAGDLVEAMRWQYRILELFDLMLNPFEFPDGFRAAAEMRGFRFGRGRQPMTGAQQADRAALQSSLQCLLSDFGFVAPPAAGCAPRGQGPDQDKIAQLVYEVMHALEKRGAL